MGILVNYRNNRWDMGWCIQLPLEKNSAADNGTPYLLIVKNKPLKSEHNPRENLLKSVLTTPNQPIFG